MSESHRSQPMFVSTGNPETVSDSPSRVESSAGWRGQLGKFLTVKQPGPAGTPGVEEYRDKTYRYVRTDSSMTVAPFLGAVAWWRSRQTYLVTTDVSAAESQNAVAGVFQYPVTPGDYCFVQTRGPASVKFNDAEALAAQTAGNQAIPSSTDGKADTETAGTAPTYALIGYCTGNGDAAAALAVVELELPEKP